MGAGHGPVDLADPERRRRWKAELAGVLRDRRVICALGPLAAHTTSVRLLHEYGARTPLVLATGTGAGPVPSADEARICFLSPPATTTMSEAARQTDGYLRNGLPPEVLAEIADYDPDGEAVWLVDPFVDVGPLLGRQVLGGRPASWVALEDKTTVDELWAALDVPRAPYRLVPVDTAALAAIDAELHADPGSGTVWSGDARDGLNGGGEYVRWVVTPEDRAAAVAFFEERCDRVRVMPFLDGVPCSIHGCVFPDGTAVLRPVELAILRGPARRFVYGGLGTTWDPPDVDREQMRDLARRAGERLRELVGYRGFFGIDGILTADGFRPTELNPRRSGGVAAIANHLDAPAFDLLQLTLVAGRDPMVGAADLEAWVVPALDRTRFARAIAVGPTRSGEPVDAQSIPVTWDGATLRRAEPEDPSAWTVEAGPSPAGVYARLVAPGVEGLTLGRLNAALMHFLDAEVGTAFGPVTPAPDVRRG